MFELLTVVFVVLKVLEVGVVANWSWWLVFSPFLVALALYSTIIVVYLFIELSK